MRSTPLQGLTIKAALILGFGLTVGLWFFTGYDFTGRMEQVERESAAITTRYMQAQELLASVRAQVLVASVYVRDALLDSDPVSTSGYRQKLDDTYLAIDQALQRYVPVIDAASEREQVQRLRREIDEFRGTMRRVLEGDAGRSSREARRLLNREVVPRREAVIRVSEEVQALNRAAFITHRDEISALHRVAERETWQRLGLALAATLAIAFLAVLYAGRLEGRLWRQLEKDAQNTRDLQHLSAKLISAQEEERRNIARELHDEVGQVLTAIKVELSVAQRTIDAAGETGGLLDDAQGITDAALNTVRDLSQLLHPALLDDLGLPAAVDSYVRGLAKRSGLKIDFRHDHMGRRLASEVELAAYRVIQEALTNVARHANASTCSVVLTRDHDTLQITVVDDGKGFSTRHVEQAGAAAGLGLVGLRERALQLGGTAVVTSELGRGTRVEISLPARPRAVPRVDDRDASMASPAMAEPHHG